MKIEFHKTITSFIINFEHNDDMWQKLCLIILKISSGIDNNQQQKILHGYIKNSSVVNKVKMY